MGLKLIIINDYEFIAISLLQMLFKMLRIIELFLSNLPSCCIHDHCLSDGSSMTVFFVNSCLLISHRVVYNN